VTFLFTDVEGSTSAWIRNPGAMPAALARHDAIIEKLVAEYDGQVVRPRGEGDSRFAVFLRATDGVVAACAIQIALVEEPWPLEAPLRVRMALHTGEADLRTGDYYGPAVNHCARLRAVAHGAQVLVSSVTADLVREGLAADITLRDLGEHRLKDLSRPERIFQLVHPDQAAEFPPLRTLDTLPNNLPLQLTSFIGREQAMVEVKRLLGTTRLLTLTGHGGTGKTRLALQVAADVLEAYPDGVWLVELADLIDPVLVPQAVAAAVRVPEEPGRPLLATLTEALRFKHLLLVLDNCEHLVEACARVADTLLRACPTMRILATSREALGIAGETASGVPSLVLPDPQHAEPVELLMQCEAVQLFVDRALTVQPAFQATNANALAVAQICARLDGIPLAIELAAACVRVLPAQQLLGRLEDRFRLLTGGSRVALPRHQTLRAAVDWSYDLLTEQEKLLFSRLSVFAGGWTLEAAEAVCAGNGIARDEVLDLLARLVDKSLALVREQPDGTARYRLLESVRQYGWDRLLVAGAAMERRNCHLTHFVAWTEQLDSKLRGPEQLVWLERLEPEQDNLRAALDWALTGGDPEAALRLAGEVRLFWEARGHRREGYAWLERAIAATPQVTGSHRANALARTSSLAVELGHMARATELLEASLVLRRALGDKQFIGYSLTMLGSCLEEQGELERATSLYAEGLALHREIGHRWGIAEAVSGLASVAARQEDWDRAVTLHEESVALYRETGDQLNLAFALLLFGGVVLTRGQTAEARVLYEESDRLYRQLNDKSGVAWARRALGAVAYWQADHEWARVLYEEGLALAQELGERAAIAACLDSLGRLARVQGELARAARFGEESLALYRDLGLKGDLASSLIGLAGSRLDAGEPSRAVALFAEALRLSRELKSRTGIGYSLSGLGGIARALDRPRVAVRLLASTGVLFEALGVPMEPAGRATYAREVAPVRAERSEELFAAAWAEGEAMSLEQAFACALEDTPEGTEQTLTPA
jgi:predicted ATPase/class 3 adenylate cyclase